jgi:hypothetical protein
MWNHGSLLGGGRDDKGSAKGKTPANGRGFTYFPMCLRRYGMHMYRPG